MCLSFFNVFVFVVVFALAFAVTRAEVDLSKLRVKQACTLREICIFGAKFYEELRSIHAQYVAPPVFYGAASLDPAHAAVLHP